LVYPNLWPKVDMRLRERSGVLKYEFHVHPGASPSDIQLAYDGADGLTLGKRGGLQVATPLGMLADSVPLSYQVIGGARVPVASRYVLADDLGAKGRFSFDIDRYQRDRELIIDPRVQYTTFLGGNSAETGAGIAVNAAGNAYVAGTTQSPDFPTPTGAFDRTGAPQNFADVFVTKLNPAGTALVYSTFVGGSDMEFGRRIAIDAAGISSGRDAVWSGACSSGGNKTKSCTFTAGANATVSANVN
jgi:Beta-propeller repeat